MLGRVVKGEVLEFGVLVAIILITRDRNRKGKKVVVVLNERQSDYPPEEPQNCRAYCCSDGGAGGGGPKARSGELGETAQ